jgi:hypothetical protein
MTEENLSSNLQVAKTTLENFLANNHKYLGFVHISKKITKNQVQTKLNIAISNNKKNTAKDLDLFNSFSLELIEIFKELKLFFRNEVLGGRVYLIYQFQ